MFPFYRFYADLDTYYRISDMLYGSCGGWDYGRIQEMHKKNHRYKVRCRRNR